MQETRVQSLGQEDPQQKEMATHSSILAWEIPWTEEPGGLQFMVSRVGHNLVTKPPPLYCFPKSQKVLNSKMHLAQGFRIMKCGPVVGFNNLK